MNVTSPFVTKLVNLVFKQHCDWIIFQVPRFECPNSEAALWYSKHIFSKSKFASWKYGTWSCKFVLGELSIRMINFSSVTNFRKAGSPHPHSFQRGWECPSTVQFIAILTFYSNMWKTVNQSCEAHTAPVYLLVIIHTVLLPMCLNYTTTPGLSLRGGGWGFPPATMNLAPGYFQRKIEEKKNQKKPFTVWFPT